jgi:hypothetical protein
MNDVPQIQRLYEPSKEQEQFWQEQSKRQKASGLTRLAYCRKHALNYDQFGYWERKWRKKMEPSAKLLPVHLNPLPKLNANPQRETLCTLAFKNGHELKIHDKTVLPLLLSLWS